MKPPRKALLVLLIVLCVILAALLAAAVILSRSGGTGESETTAAPTGSGETAQSGTTGSSADMPSQPWQDTIAFPVSLESGKLELVSLFQFSGLNPDCGGQEGTDIAGIQIRNTSGSHLTRAAVEMTLSGGKRLRFLVEDLPAGMTALAFSDENVSMDTEETCVTLSCDASFEEESPLMADRLAVSVEGTRITVTNVSGEDLTGLTVYCHCLLDRDSFGGLTYSYSVDSLPAGGSATVDAWDCLLGAAEVVRIGMADQ